MVKIELKIKNKFESCDKKWTSYDLLIIYQNK